MIKFPMSSENELLVFLKNQKFKKIFVLSGEKSLNLSGAKRILNRALKKKIVRYYLKISPYPDFLEQKKIIFSIRQFFPDIIVAVGGGSVLDYAKIANVLNLNQNLETQIKHSSYKIIKKFTKLLAIPTTAGSGAEVTSSAVIYINKVKYSIESEKLKPDYFFLIPKLISNCPKKIKSSAGFDVISQAIESLISRKSNTSSVNFAKKSLEISLQYYLKSLKKNNYENNAAMSFAANLAGKAISISKTTAPHAVSYPFTSFFNVSHGHAVSLTFNKFLKFNYENIKKAKCNFDLKKRYDIIFSLTGCKNINQLDEYLLNIKKFAGLESNLKKLGVDIKKDYAKILSGTNILRLSNNPIELKKSDLKFILLKNY